MPKILIVEDEHQLARFIQLELEHEDYETTVAGDGRQGLSLAESGEFDLILLDILSISGRFFAVNIIIGLHTG